jgi:orotidine-5'-phosphate decarboxylase
VDYVPTGVVAASATVSDAIFSYNKAIIDATADCCACYKVQIAYYEALGVAGLAAFARTLRYIADQGRLSIADIKRGDIADTAVQYAKAFYDNDFAADFVTLAPYMGMDSIAPWVDSAAKKGKGAFVLMRTSNPGRGDFQCQKTGDGRFFYDLVGEKVAGLAEIHHGERGYGAFGIVVGCTESVEAADIRAAYPGLFFLVPGYGAQGGGGEDAARLLVNGNGGVVNASRSILWAWKKADPALGTETDRGKALAGAADAAREACLAMRFDIERAVRALAGGNCDGCTGV